MFRIIGFQIRDLADEKFQFAIYNYVTTGKGLNCSELGFSVSQSYIGIYVSSVTLSVYPALKPSV